MGNLTVNRVIINMDATRKLYKVLQRWTESEKETLRACNVQALEQTARRKRPVGPHACPHNGIEHRALRPKKTNAEAWEASNNTNAPDRNAYAPPSYWNQLRSIIQLASQSSIGRPFAFTRSCHQIIIAFVVKLPTSLCFDGVNCTTTSWPIKQLLPSIR